MPVTLDTAHAIGPRGEPDAKMWLVRCDAECFKRQYVHAPTRAEAVNRAVGEFGWVIGGGKALCPKHGGRRG